MTSAPSTASSYGSLTSLVVTALVLLWITWMILRLLGYLSKPTFRQRSVAILVLGDIGRSPRMMYHAESFAQNQFETYFVGYEGSAPIPSLMRLPHVHFVYLSEPLVQLGRLPFVLLAPVKVLFQVASITIALLLRISPTPEFILVQNPPSIPTLAIVWFVSRVRGSKVIIDWHNLGYSILAMKIGQKHLFVRIAKWFEATFGRSAYAHLFVTQAMHDHLVQEWGLVGLKAILHDRPPKHFHRTTPQDFHRLFRDLAPHFTEPPLTTFFPPFSLPYSTPFTMTTSSWDSSIPSTPLSHSQTPGSYPIVCMPTLRPDRPALIVSSTSWTPDEDFGMLLDALDIYERKARAHDTHQPSRDIPSSSLPKLLAVVTGKGPLKDKYMDRVRKFQSGEPGKGWKWVRCISLWLEARDYPLLLGSADLGVSLHSSSSSLDLPMKVVDMFGCGLPVCALNFRCLHELVKDGVNGLVFATAEQLADQLETLFTSFPHSPALERLRSGLSKSSHPPSGVAHAVRARGEGVHWEWGTWEENWSKVVRPLVLSDLAKEDQ